MTIPNWFYQSMRETSYRTADWFGFRKLKKKVAKSSAASAENYLLVCCTHGKLSITYSDIAYTLQKNEMLLLPPGEQYIEEAEKVGDELLRIPILLLTSTPIGSNPLNNLSLPAIVPHPNPEEFEVTVEQMRSYTQIKPKPKAHRLRLNLYMNQLLLDYLEAGFESQLLHRKTQQVEDWLIEAKTYIEDQFNNPDLTITHVAEYMGYSTWHFQREFKTAFNISPKAYLHQYRMTIAMRLMGTNPHIRISHLMERCGYRTRSLFNRLFIEQFGKPPSAFR